MNVPNPQTRILAGVHCTISIASPVAHVVVVEIVGPDIGELGDAPLVVLNDLIAGRQALELFIDARAARGPSVDVSAQWAGWLRENRERFRYVNMLTRSRFVQLTADFVQRFAELGGRMRIFTEPAAFDTALELASRA